MRVWPPVHLAWGWLEGEILTCAQSPGLLISPICPWLNLVSIFKTRMRVDPLLRFTNCWRISLHNLAPDEAVGPWIQLSSYFCGSLCGLRQPGRPRPGWFDIVPAAATGLALDNPSRSFLWVTSAYLALLSVWIHKSQWTWRKLDESVISAAGSSLRVDVVKLSGTSVFEGSQIPPCKQLEELSTSSNSRRSVTWFILPLNKNIESWLYCLLRERSRSFHPFLAPISRCC